MNWISALGNWTWEYALTTLIATVGAVWSVYTFTRERREDRKWRQVEFLLRLNQYLFESNEMRECIKRLDDTYHYKELEYVFTNTRALLTDKEIQILEQFRHFFQFFSNLDYCVGIGVLSIDQVDLFGWYLYRINNIEFIRDYCNKNGFDDVIVFANKLRRHAYSKS